MNNAEDAGAIGVLIVNTSPSETGGLFPGSFAVPAEDGGPIQTNIPAVMVRNGLGQLLISQLANSEEIMVRLAVTEPFREAAIPLEPGNFNVRQIRVTGNTIDDHAEARRIIDFANGNGPNEGWNIVVDQSDTRNLIDIAGSGGNFPHNHPYPDGTTGEGQNDVLIHVTTIRPFFVPEGEWTIGFVSDDGAQLTLSGVTFNEENGTDDADAGLDDTLLFNAAGAFGATSGSFTSPPGGMTVDVDASFFERSGGDVFEITIKEGHFGNSSPINGTWVSLRDGALGWTVQSDPILSDLTGNGFVDFEDLTVLLANWNKDVGVAGGNLVSPLVTVVNFET
ncbi:MAG: hypothetical protein IID44_27235 [Planctomycetes bacterium]|nr:hypothetical protein [Planctomycetota bacterium]